MNSTQPIYFPQFIPPQPESLLSSKTVVFFVLNLFTLGFYGAAETVIKQHRIKKLEADGQELQQKVHQLSNSWSELEVHLFKLIDQFKDLNRENDQEFQKLNSKITNLSNENRAWKQLNIQSDIDFKNGLTEFALNTIAFIGHLIANILTIGLYGVYQNYQLKNHVKILKAEHQHVEKEIKNIQEAIAEKVETHLKLVKKGAELAKDLDLIEKTPADVSRQQAVSAKQQRTTLEQDYDDLKTRIDAIRVRVTAAETLKRTNETNLARGKDELRQLRLENANLIREKNDLESEKNRYQRDENRDRNVVPELREQLNSINEKAGRVKELEQEVQQLQQAVEIPANFDQLKKSVGPVPPRYKQRPEDQEIEGALDYKQDPARLDELDAAEAEEIRAYNARYDGKIAAANVLEAGFEFAFKSLMDMKEKEKAQGNQKIQFVGCAGTVGTPGEFSVYRYMVWDWLKRGKLHQGAEGYEVKINEHVSMLPSEPKKVLRYKTELDGKRKPIVELHYTRQDGFTATFDEIKKANGVNPVGAKWLIEQLTPEEQDHLFNLLMAPVIEDENPDYIKTKEYMRDSTNPRVQLVLMAFEHIAEIGEVIQRKFIDNVLVDCWSNAVDAYGGDDEWSPPFLKASDAQPEIIEEVAPDKRVVKWELDEDVIGDKRAGDYAPRQPQFAALIKKTKEELQTIFKYLDKTYVDASGEEQPLDILAYREKREKINNPSWSDINNQFYNSHHVFATYKGYGNSNHWCLFSNLTTVLLNDYDNVTDANVWAVKKAMANYLDKLLAAKRNWDLVKDNVPLPEGADKLKELASLAEDFRLSIRSDYNWTLEQYQKWLRNEPGAPGSPNAWTPADLTIAGYAFGVRICLISIGAYDKGAGATVDKYGRITGEYYGPNTEEVLYMGAIPGSFYGLFPKLNLTSGYGWGAGENQNLKKHIDPQDWPILKKYEAAWILHNDKNKAK